MVKENKTRLLVWGTVRRE